MTRLLFIFSFNMKKFIIKTGLFLFVVCSIIIGVSFSLNVYLRTKSVFIIDKKINSVVFGHSHPEMAFNDSLINNFKNLAQAGESYFYTYIKARQVFKNNPQIKNVFIEFSNIDITKIRDEQIWSDKYINWRYPTYSEWMSIQEHCFLLYKNPKSLIATLPKTYKKQIKRIQTKNYNLVNTTSGYLYITDSKVDSLLQKNAHLEAPDPKYFEKSSYNLFYLKKIVTLCIQNNKNVYFVRSPLYKNSFYRWNEKLYKKVKNEQFPEIELLDFVNYKVPNEYFRDLHHLNYKGAKVFSEMFNEWLSQKYYK